MTKPLDKLLHSLDIRREFGAPAFPVTPIPPETMRNGVVVRMPNWLGDAVMALPALRQLKNMLPEHCALAVITPRGMRPFYHALPWVDLILPLHDAHRRWRLEEFGPVPLSAAATQLRLSRAAGSRIEPNAPRQ